MEETLIECGIGKLTAHVNIAVNNEYHPAADRPISDRYSFFKCCNNWKHATDDNAWIGRVTRCGFDTKWHGEIHQRVVVRNGLWRGCTHRYP